jgi:hypothetical protein
MDHDSGGNMADPHGAVGYVSVLATRSRTTVELHLDFILMNCDTHYRPFPSQKDFPANSGESAAGIPARSALVRCRNDEISMKCREIDN